MGRAGRHRLGAEPARRSAVVHVGVEHGLSASDSYTGLRPQGWSGIRLLRRTLMPDLFRRLHRRYAAPDGITRREMLQRSLAAAAGVLLSERLVRSPRRASRDASSSSAPASAAWRRRTSFAGRLRRHRRRGAQPSRRPRPELLRLGARQERRGRRRADRLQPSDLGGLRQEVRARVPRRHRGGRRSADHARRQAADRGRAEALWEEMEAASNR